MLSDLSEDNSWAVWPLPTYNWLNWTWRPARDQDFPGSPPVSFFSLGGVPGLEATSSSEFIACDKLRMCSMNAVVFFIGESLLAVVCIGLVQQPHFVIVLNLF